MKRRQEEEEVELDDSLIDNPYSHLVGKRRIVNQVLNHLGSESNGKRSTEVFKEEDDLLSKISNKSKTKHVFNQFKYRKSPKHVILREDGDDFSLKNEKLRLKFW